MTNSTLDHSQLLDQLQSEVNLVLEHTGRLFAAANENPKAVPIAHITRLKQVLPESTDRFHEALDRLEDELQAAKLVMRRDLALCRERAGVSKTPQVNGVGPSGEVAKKDDPPPGDVTMQDEPKKIASSEDVEMQDPKPSLPLAIDEPPAPELAVEGEPENSSKHDTTMDEQPANPTAQDEPTGTEPKPPDPILQIDTQPQPKAEGGEINQADEDVPPDTGTFSNTNDLESLFGAPTSAEAGDAPDFGIDPNSNTEFDFGSFGTNLDNNGGDNDNDNIAALLPGLQDYANTQPSGSGEPDFDALFSTDLPMAGDGQGDGQQTSTGPHDSTFDDLMDFADFNAGDFAAGSGGNGSNVNQDFDFSFD